MSEFVTLQHRNVCKDGFGLQSKVDSGKSCVVLFCIPPFISCLNSTLEQMIHPSCPSFSTHSALCGRLIFVYNSISSCSIPRSSGSLGSSCFCQRGTSSKCFLHVYAASQACLTDDHDGLPINLLTSLTPFAERPHRSHLLF